MERYNLYKDGLRIYTTIDSRLQSIAEESVNEHMKNLQSEFLLKTKNQMKIQHLRLENLERVKLIH